MRKYGILTSVLVVVGLLMLPVQAKADPPELLSYQGVLVNSDGTLLSDGTYSVTFSIYEVPVGGADPAPFSQTLLVAVKHGLYNVILSGPELVDVFSTAQAFMEVKIPVQTGIPTEIVLAPRQQIASVPYALVADKAVEAAVAVTLLDPPHIPWRSYTYVNNYAPGTIVAGDYWAVPLIDTAQGDDGFEAIPGFTEIEIDEADGSKNFQLNFSLDAWNNDGDENELVIRLYLGAKDASLGSLTPVYSTRVGLDQYHQDRVRHVGPVTIPGLQITPTAAASYLTFAAACTRGHNTNLDERVLLFHDSAFGSFLEIEEIPEQPSN